MWTFRIIVSAREQRESFHSLSFSNFERERVRERREEGKESESEQCSFITTTMFSTRHSTQVERDEEAKINFIARVRINY
jgi:hypothetical protein